MDKGMRAGVALQRTHPHIVVREQVTCHWQALVACSSAPQATELRRLTGRRARGKVYLNSRRITSTYLPFGPELGQPGKKGGPAMNWLVTPQTELEALVFSIGERDQESHPAHGAWI
jgi:hypothetical protein